MITRRNMRHQERGGGRNRQGVGEGKGTFAFIDQRADMEQGARRSEAYACHLCDADLCNVN